MKKLLITVFFISIGIGLHAKDKIFYIELVHELFTIENCDFYISTVLDERNDTTSIGFAQIGAFNKKVPAKLIGGVENSFFDFISSSLTKQDGFSEIILKVQELRVSEHTTFSSETGEAILSIQFFAYNQNNELVNVFETKSFVNEQALDVTKGHENRVRLAIIDCLKRFSVSSWQENLNSSPVITENDTLKPSVNTSTVDQIILNEKNPRFLYNGQSYVSLTHLQAVILNSGDQKVIDGFKKYKNTQGTANAFACLGGALIGYPLGAAITTGRLNTDVMLSGVALFVIALIVQGEANKVAIPLIEDFNAQNNTTSSYYKLQQPNSFQFSYSIKF